MTPHPQANALRVNAGALAGEANALMGCMIDVRPLASRVEVVAPRAAAALRHAWAEADYAAMRMRRLARELEADADQLDPPRVDV